MRLVLVQQRLGGSGGAGGEMSQLSNVPLAIGGFDANEVAKTAMTVPILTTLLLLLLLPLCLTLWQRRRPQSAMSSRNP
jgi:hypothetical protein